VQGTAKRDTQVYLQVSGAVATGTTCRTEACVRHGQSAIQQWNPKDRRVTRESNYLDKTLRAYKTPFCK